MRIPHIFHGIETGAETTAPKRGEPMQPVGNDVGIQMSAHGSGSVSATVQIKGRIDDRASLENIGNPITISGTASSTSPVTASVEVHTIASNLYVDLIASSVMSFRAVGTEAEK